MIGIWKKKAKKKRYNKINKVNCFINRWIWLWINKFNVSNEYFKRSHKVSRVYWWRNDWLDDILILIKWQYNSSFQVSTNFSLTVGFFFFPCESLVLVLGFFVFCEYFIAAKIVLKLNLIESGFVAFLLIHLNQRSEKDPTCHIYRFCFLTLFTFQCFLVFGIYSNSLLLHGIFT